MPKQPINPDPDSPEPGSKGGAVATALAALLSGFVSRVFAEPEKAAEMIPEIRAALDAEFGVFLPKDRAS